MRPSDLCALGAACLPTRELLGVLLKSATAAELVDAERALSLVGAARDAALRGQRLGPQLLASVELGRRAWLLPSPAGRRVRAPVDVASVVGPRASEGDDTWWLLALDLRLTLARLTTVRHDPADVLRASLAAGAARIVVATRRPAPAVPDSEDLARVERLALACAVVGVPLVDAVVLGDDGYCSLLRLGLLPSTDRRYQ